MAETTRLDNFTKLFAANTSAESIVAPAPTSVLPTGDGVLDLNVADYPQSPLPGANGVVLAFYGTRTSADNETFTARVTGWRLISNLWVPVPLLALSLQQGNSVGVNGLNVTVTEYFADTITASTAFTSANEIISPADDSIGFVKVDPIGCRFIQVQLKRGSNAACNCLAARY